MKIVIVQRITLEHGVRGGMETQAQSLAEGLQQRGHSVLVLTTPHPDGRASGEECGVPVRYLSPGSWRRYDARWWRACEQAVRHLFRDGACDLLLSQSAGALDFLPRISADLGLPTVVVIHGTLQGAVRTTAASARSPRGLYRLARLALTLPGHTLLWRRAGRTVDRWLVPVPAIAEEWRRELSLPADRIALVPYGIDTARFTADRAAARARFGLAEGDLAVVGVGRLEHGKGYQHAIAAIRALAPRFPAARLLLAGAGPYAAQLQQQAHGAPVELLGHVPNDELPALLAAADVFVMPTVSFETFPISLAEAAAAGLPIVASQIGGIPDMLQHGRLGVLVPPTDETALERELADLLGDAGRRRELGAAARTHAQTHFSRTAMLDGVEQVLRDAAARHERSRA